MAIRNIVKYGDEVLRKKSRPVETVDYKIQILLHDMVQTLHSTGNGAGLAAVQVGVLRRVVVIDMGQGVIKLVNPEIVARSGRQEVIEACLSIPGRQGRVERPFEVTVKALDEKGREFTIKGQGELAKCLCHEIDHLDGILFIDRLIEEKSERTRTTRNE